MRLDQVFGLLLILLAIYLGVTASRVGADGELFGGGTDGGLFGGDGAVGTGGDRRDDANGVPDDDADRTVADAPQRSTGREPAVAGSDFCAAVPETSQYRDLGTAHDAAIRCMDAAGIMQGRSSSQFDPNDAVTRGEAAVAIAAMIDRANELEAKGVDLQHLPDANDARFQDFKDGSADCPGERAVARLNESPVLQGYVDSRYEPCGKVTRAQMASMLDRAYQYMNSAALPIGADQFTDDDTSVHEESINAVAAADIMRGRGDRFRPGSSVRRGQMASHLTRIMIRMEDKGRIMPL